MALPVCEYPASTVERDGAILESGQSSIQDVSGQDGQEQDTVVDKTEQTSLSYELMGFNKMNIIQRSVFSRGTTWALKLVVFGQILVDLLFLVWVGWNHFRDRDLYVITPSHIYQLTLFTLLHLRVMAGLLRKLAATHVLNLYRNYIHCFFPLSVLFDSLELTWYFFVCLSPGGTVHNWETISLYGVSLIRLIAAVQLPIMMESGASHKPWDIVKNPNMRY